MKKLFGFAAVAAMALGVNACGVGAVVDDINNALDEAAFQVKAEDAFGTAISTVTMQVVATSLIEAGNAMTAPAAPYNAADAVEVNVTLAETTSQVDGGGTVTVSGTLSGNVESTTGAGELTLDITSKWADLPSTLDDGTVVTTTGESKVTGTMVISEDGNATGTFTNVGNLTLDGTKVEFNVTVAFDTSTGTITITGTVNGSEMFPQTITVPVEQDTTSYVCSDTANYTCKEYAGGASFDYVAALCGATNTVEGPCPTTDVIGICTYKEGDAAFEIVTTYYVGSEENQSTCEGQGGDYTWTEVL